MSKLFETLIVVALLGGWFVVARTAEGVMRDDDSAAAAASASAPSTRADEMRATRVRHSDRRSDGASLRTS